MSGSHRIRNSFITGLLLVAPLVITIITLQILLGWLTGLVGPLVTATDLSQFTGNIEYLGRLLALVLLVGLIVLIGFVAQWSITDRVFGGVDRLIGFIPMVRVIYTSVRQVANSLVSPGSRYESVVLVEYPRDGLYAIGFVTAESPEPVQTAIGRAYNVYLPMSPNPTNGHLAMIPEDDVHEVDISVRRGIRLMVTTGMAETSQELEDLDVDSPLLENIPHDDPDDQ